MWIPLYQTIILLLTTALLFYLLPKYKIHWQILVILIWLWGISWLVFAHYQTNKYKIFIPSQYSLMET